MTLWTPEPYLGRGATNIPISNSEIQTFKENRREWWLRYYLGLRPKQPILEGPLPLGTRVHFALESMYRDGLDPVDAYMSQLEVDRALFEEMISEYDDSDRRKKFDSDAELGRIMVEGYLEWIQETNADSNLEIVDIEKEVRYPVLGGRVILRGKVDMKVRDLTNNARYAMDHKTCQSFKEYYETAHMSEQLLMYTLLEKLHHADDETPVEGGIYNLLRKVKRSKTSKPPFYERIVVRFNPTILETYWTRLHGVLYDMMRVRDALDNGADHQVVAYPTINRDLVWKSKFFPVYHLLDDGSNASGWLEDFTEVHDPYERYGTEEDVEDNKL